MPYEAAQVKCYLTVVHGDLLKQWNENHQIVIEKLKVVNSPDGKQVAKYQREGEKGRITKIRKFLSQDVANSIIPPILPQSIVLNVRRNFDVRPRNGIATLPSGIVMHVIDGQHRIMALLESEADLPVPATITVGLTEEQEAGLFLLMNHTQKRVPATVRLLDIARLLQENRGDYNLDPLFKIMGFGTAESRDSLVLAANEVLKRRHFWFGKVRLPGEE